MIKRKTVQRSLILETVRELQSHATADEVYKMIVKKHPNISRGTVYRNLTLLTDIGEISKMEMPSGADRYEHLCCEHYHAKCTKCGQVFDVEMKYITDLERNIIDTHGFEFTGHDVIFRGICHECNSSLNRQTIVTANMKAKN